MVDVERTVHLYRLALPHRRRPLGKHGTGHAARRPPSPLEPKRLDRNRRWGYCRLHSQGEGHSHRSSGCSEVWRRVGFLAVLLGELCWADTSQTESEAPDQGRQQRWRRYRAVRQGTRLFGQGRHYRVCSEGARSSLDANQQQDRCRLCPFRRLRHNHALGAPMDEDGHVGDNGPGGDVAARIGVSRIDGQRQYQACFFLA